MSNEIHFKTESTYGPPWPSLLSEQLEAGWECFSIVKVKEGDWISYFKKVKPKKKK